MNCNAVRGKVSYGHNTHTTVFTALLTLSGTTWMSQYENKLIPILVISHPLSASSIYYYSRHPPCSIYMPDSLFQQSCYKCSLVYLLAWHHQLHTPYISSPNHCLLFAEHDNNFATYFAVIPRLCHINKPTRVRGGDQPHILDLVLSNKPFIENIDILAPLGKSDHSLISTDCKLQTVDVCRAASGCSRKPKR